MKKPSKEIERIITKKIEESYKVWWKNSFNKDGLYVPVETRGGVLVA